MATRTHGRHAAQPARHRVTTAITHAVGWMLADHDDRIPNRIQTLIWIAALITLFVCLGLQR